MDWVLISAWLVWSGYQPVNPVVWWFEAAPAVGVLAFLGWTDVRWRLTPLVRYALLLGVALMFVGAHYTYARMPLFTWLQDLFAWKRNHFDRFGHFFQGAAPALLLREWLIRKSVLAPGVWLQWLVLGSALAMSAAWELVEWAAVVLANGEPDVYLNFQGDPWDTQADMACALAGASIALVAFRAQHDRQLAQLIPDKPPHAGNTKR